MELVKVYAPKTGEMFEVQHERAAQLVLNSGWSRTAPGVAQVAPAAVQAPAQAAPVTPAPVAPAPAAAAPAAPVGNLADRLIASAEAHIAGTEAKAP